MSADGKLVYFIYGFQNFNIETTEIGRVSAAGGPLEPVISTTRRAVSPYPSPDGRGLLYAANPDSADLALWWKDLSTGRTSRVTTGIGEYNSPTMSADGQRLAGTVFDVKQSLERIAVDFARPAKFEPITNGFSGDLDPEWSPDSRDGRQIAFVSDRGGRRGIWVVAAAGAPRLIVPAVVLNTVSWSPDSRRLVFSTPIGDAPGLMIVDVATGQTTSVRTPGPASFPAWSPVEDVIAYTEPRGGSAGSFLKFIKSTGEALRFQEMPQQIANGFVAWSADGKRLAAVSLPGVFGGSIWVGEPASTTPFRKLIDLPAGSYLRGATWSRDGSSLILGRIETTGDIFFAERTAK